MIDFNRVIDDVTLDCDAEPKTVFRIRSLNFEDELVVQTELQKLGDAPTGALARLQKRWDADGYGAKLDEQESHDLEVCTRYRRERERLICSRGVIEIARSAVQPEDVLRLFGELPAALRDQVQTELAKKILSLGAPAPKPEEPSGSPLGSGRIAITPGGVVNSAG